MKAPNIQLEDGFAKRGLRKSLSPPPRCAKRTQGLSPILSGKGCLYVDAHPYTLGSVEAPEAARGALRGSLRHPVGGRDPRRVAIKTQTTASGGVGLGRGGRMSRQRKRDAVLRLLRGEDLEILSRALGVTAATLSGWQDTFLSAGEFQAWPRGPPTARRWRPSG